MLVVGVESGWTPTFKATDNVITFCIDGTHFCHVTAIYVIRMCGLRDATFVNIWSKNNGGSVFSDILQ